jgi:hypothetical protein
MSITKEQTTQLLLKYLQKGGEVRFQSQCKKCCGASITSIPGTVRTFVEEVKYYTPNGKECLFDIGGVDSKGVVVFGINICKEGGIPPLQHKDYPLLTIEDINYRMSIYDELLFLTNYSIFAPCDGHYCSQKKD